MIVSAGKVSFLFFLISSINTLILVFPQNLFHYTAGNICCYLLIYFSAAVFICILFLKDSLYEVGVRACFLGTIFSWGTFVAVMAPDSYTVFGWYMCILSFFHYSEFLAIAVTNPSSLTIDSYILDHSPDYKIAAAASWIEFFIERWWHPDMKCYKQIATIGLVMCISGEILRKLAMFTAGRNFTHTVRSEKGADQTLVVNGLYSIFRHPSYVGWFYWAVGTQIVLLNPLCSIAYLAASWKFFNDRITIEELTLLNFFGYDYVEYQKKVPTGLPFIKGYLLED